MTLRFTVPGRTRNTSNLRENHFAKAKRVKAERAKAMTLCPHWAGGPLLTVTLWRFGPRTLDGDGLQSALKATRDGIASRLRIDDGSPLVRWEYYQATCSFGQERVEVVISPSETQPGWPHETPMRAVYALGTQAPEEAQRLTRATARARTTSASYPAKTSK